MRFKEFFHTILQESKEPFDWDSLNYRYSSTEDEHRIDLSNNSGAVGFIVWNIDGGEVERFHVGDKIRRLGIGTHLWELATEYSEEHGFDPPAHSDRRTQEGDAFAQSVGGHIPNLKDDVDGWSSR